MLVLTHKSIKKEVDEFMAEMNKAIWDQIVYGYGVVNIDEKGVHHVPR